MARSISLGFAAIALMAVGVASGALAEEASVDPAPLDQPLAATETYSRPGIEVGGFVSEDGGAGEVNTIVPLALRGSHALLYLGADGTLFSGGFDDLGDSTYNVGAYFGYRQRLTESGAVVGGWIGADTLKTDYGQAYQRFIAGAEYFGDRIIARANAFVPFDDTSSWDELAPRQTVTTNYSVTTPTEVVSHTRTATRTTTNTFEEQIPSGFDAEVGLRFALPAFDTGRRPGELRAFAGLYDYMGLKQDGGDVIGGRGRLELDLYPLDTAPDVRLALTASYSEDSHTGGQVDGGVRLAIPLGAPVTHVADADSSGGSLKDSDPTPRLASSGGRDLFQPVRRNNLPVSVKRLKSQTTRTALVDRVTRREPVDTAQVGFTLANVCGGPSAPITFTWDDSAPTLASVGQGDLIGTIEPFGTNVPLTVDIASMVDASGQTLAQLLANAPATINTTLTFPTSFVDFNTMYVEPVSAIIAAAPAWASYSVVGVSLLVNGSSCTLSMSVAAAAGSDRRLKRDIEQVATLGDGTKLYSFRYLESFDPSGETYVGVMAQDVLSAHPDAIVRMRNGYYGVRYDRLGLKMATLEDWRAHGVAAVRLGGR